MIFLENSPMIFQISQAAFEIVVDSSDVSFRATFESPSTATTFQVYSCRNLPICNLSINLALVVAGYHPIPSHPISDD